MSVSSLHTHLHICSLTLAFTASMSGKADLAAGSGRISSRIISDCSTHGEHVRGFSVGWPQSTSRLGAKEVSSSGELRPNGFRETSENQRLILRGQRRIRMKESVVTAFHNACLS